MASNLTYTGTNSAAINFGRAVGHILFTADAGSTLTLSFDNGVTAIKIPVGFYSFPVGLITSIDIIGTGTWQLVGIQS